jgi:hypothetical protein
MKRREFLGMAAPLALSAAPLALPEEAPLALSAAPGARLTVPVHRIVDARAGLTNDRMQHLWTKLWNEAAQDFRQGGIDLDVSDGAGEIGHTAADNPIFKGLRGRAINVVVTDMLPMYWDQSRALAGMSTIHDGYHLCVIALRYAHGNQVAFLSTNTCLHEMLHVLLMDIYLKAPKWYQISGREARVDYYATRLWIFHDGKEARKSTEAYLRRLQTSRV